MKSVLMLADSPEGTVAILKWDSNGCQDHLSDSIAMNVMGNLVALMRTMEESGALRVISSPDDEPVTGA